MFKKFLAYLSAAVVLVGIAAMIYVNFLFPSKYPVFVESFAHGMMTVDNADTSGTDDKFMLRARRGSTVTININPERNEKVYYNLDKLVVDGEDVTKDVNMLQYKLKVKKKTSVLAYFKKGKRPGSQTVTQTGIKYENAPDILLPANSEYLGCKNATDFSDPTIIYDSNSKYYYCFGSNNVSVRSKDLLNWESRTTYLPSPEGGDDNSVISFNAFPAVKKWALEHGYDDDELFSSPSSNRQPKSPDIVKIGSTYYLYFSIVKSENSNEAAIFCLKTTDLKNAVENKDWDEVGVVISTCGRAAGSDKKNPDEKFDASFATDPSVFTDSDGKLYMAYGRYFGTNGIKGSIHIVELDPKTGLLLSSSNVNTKGGIVSTLHGKTRYNAGTVIANPGMIPSLTKEDGSLVSSCDIIYNNQTKFYYMFVTYGTEQTNYNIRVARSSKPTGPYVDYNGNVMDEFAAKRNSNQYTKGFELMGGYNFTMSSNGGVSYIDAGRASTGAPSIIKTTDGKWIMALQSRLYYKYNDKITTGEIEIPEDSDETVDADMRSALEIRQIFFDDDKWPLAVAETFTDETVGQAVKASDMEGNWDVLVFDGKTDSKDYKAVERTVSQPVTILGGVAITKNNIDKNTKLSKLKFAKAGKTSYSVIIDSVNYTIYPVICWDWELSEPVLTFSGTGEDGTTIWGKKNYSSYLGVYTDTFYYVLSNSDEETRAKYEKQMNKIKESPSQSAVDSMTKKMINIIKNADKKK